MKNVDRPERRELEAKSLALDCSITATAIADLEGRLSYANKAFLELWREDTVEAVLGRHAGSFHSDPAEAEQAGRAVLETGSWHGAMGARRRDGSTFTVLVSTGLVKDPDGTPQSIFATFVDISERIDSERVLRNAQERFSAALSHNRSFVWEVNSTGLYTYASDSCKHVTGYSAPELTGKLHFFDLHPEATRAEFRAETLAVILRGEAIQLYKGLFVQKDGTDQWLSTSGQALRDETGSVCGYRGVSTDVTESVMLQHELQLRTDAMDRSITGMAMAGADGRLSYANQAFATMWRAASPEELLGRDAASFFEDQDEAGRIIAELMRIGSYHGEISARRLDHTTFPTLFAATVVRSPSGDIEYLIGTYIDITERKHIQRLEREREVAVQANHIKSTFLKNITHELKTPLNAIMGFAQVLQADETLSEDSAGFAGEISSAGNELLTVINSILDFVQLESGKVELKPELIDCDELVQLALQMLKSEAEKRHVQLLYQAHDRASPDLPPVWADRKRLLQVILNLLTNAVVYNKANGSVRVSITMSGGLLRVSVADTGIGIPPEKHAEVFSSFNRLGREALNVAGSGLGLMYTKRLVELMGGTVGFESTPGEGSVFWIELAPAQSPADHS